MIFLVASGLFLIIGIIWLLTRNNFHNLKWISPVMSDEEVLREVTGVTKKVVDIDDWALLPYAQTPIVGSILLELMTRLGLEGRWVARELELLGFLPEGFSNWEKTHPPHLSVYSKGENLQSALEKALIIGIQFARIDDDYACVGDDPFNQMVLTRQVKEAEFKIFGNGIWERHTLFNKITLVLHDMNQEAEGSRRVIIVNLLQIFENALTLLQKKIDLSMLKIPDSDFLQWGDSKDRRLYYFKMGVTNTLRCIGCLKNLGYLYRLRGVNYDVEEAYSFIGQECPPLILAEELGIERLLQMGSNEIQELVKRTLSENGSGLL